jgi:3'(2'), 5'-bisphosphate nucleotidase
MDYKNLLAEIKRTALKAGALELEHYNAGTSVMEKKDGSPVTIADQEAELMILKDLVALTPDIPIVAEEEAAAGNIPDISGGLFWLVDPLDGTKEFVRRSGDFTVNIALMRDF